MDICKYYQQGNCRYGQYCRYEHVNAFGRGARDSFNEDEVIAILIAEEVQTMERGGQWLLSCFGPFSCGPCIPGMEDLSPEEVRWEMYQAEKNGMSQQAKLHFQQLCQDMKAKRDALKNPNRETLAMLKKIAASSNKGITAGSVGGKSSNFAFATPQLGNPNNSGTSSNVFGNKAFASQSNPFSGSFTSSNTNSVFGRPNTTTNPVFGGTASFNNNLGTFGSTSTSNPVFGNNTNTPPFGSTAPTSSSVFSTSTSQSMFGQPSVFGSTSQSSNVFARPQTSQTTTTVFESGASSSNPLFGGSISSQPSASLFGGAKTTTVHPFGANANQQTTNSVFGAPATTGSFSSGIFAQQKTVPAFGGAPIFGGGSNFANNKTSMFPGQVGFPAPANSSGNIFGSSSIAPPTFGSVTQTTHAFGTIPTSSTSSAPSVFGTAQTTGPVISSPNGSPFGTAASTTTATPTTSQSFATSTSHPSQFEDPNTNAQRFPIQSSYGITSPNNQLFGNTATSTASPFGSVTSAVSTFGTSSTVTSPFGTSNFGSVKSSPFAATSTTATTTISNPFVPQMQQTSSPFGNIAPNQGNNITSTTNTTTVSSSGPFGKSSYGSIVVAIVDGSEYSIEGQLTDDEKSMYLAEKFVFSKIPLRPPTKDIG